MLTSPDYFSACVKLAGYARLIGQLVGGLCRDHTIAKGLSLKFATSGGLELEAQWAGRQSEGLVTAFALHYSWFTDEKALYTG